MFDVRSILDELMRGDPAAWRQQAATAPSAGGVGPAAAGQDTATATPDGRRPSPRPAAANGVPTRTEDPLPAATGAGGSGPNGLEDLLRNAVAGGHPAAMSGAVGAALGDLLKTLEQQTGQGRGGAFDVVRRVLGQAVTGVREGSERLDRATGASHLTRSAIEDMTGKSAEEILAQLKALVAANQVGAGAALGGLGALILGTETGRSVARAAAKLGGLALIGGLAYQAYQNYQQGRSLPGHAGAGEPPQRLAAAPDGSGFEAAALSDDGARLLIRTMIAAAAADGRIDASERQKILANLRQVGSPGEAQRFLMQEVQRPAAADDLAHQVSGREQAIQVYTAARIAVDVESDEEHAFLVDLAERLGIDDALAAQIDAAARDAQAA